MKRNKITWRKLMNLNKNKNYTIHTQEQNFKVQTLKNQLKT